MNPKAKALTDGVVGQTFEQTDVRPYLVFGLGGKRFGVRLGMVREISENLPVKPVPNTSGTFLGFCNLRGEVIGVVDIAENLGVVRERSQNPVLIICESNGGKIAVQADAVKGVMSLAADMMSVNNKASGDKGGDLLEGLVQSNDGIVMLLDLEGALDDKRFYNIRLSDRPPGFGTG